MTAQTMPFTTPEFTSSERLLLDAAQRRLIQRRLDARQLAQQPEAPRRPFRSPMPSLRAAVAAPSEPPSRPAPQEVLSASLEATLARVRRPRPGSPAALATEAVERARPRIEAALRRKDARHNALCVLRVLTQAAYALIETRGQLTHATTYTYFTVMDLLPVVTGLSSDQCERATRKLQELGLIHKTSGAIPQQQQPIQAPEGPSEPQRRYRGGTWTTTTFLDPTTGEQREVNACAGTWVAVLLQPGQNRRARVVSHELPPCPRDLTADRRHGRTAWQARQEAKNKAEKVRESRLLSGDQFDITPLLTWSLPKRENSMVLGTKDSRTSLFEHAATPQDLIWSLSRIVSVHPQGRREAVQEGAARLLQLLGDPGWERHYYRLLWRATEAEFRGLPAYAQLAHALERTLIAARELRLARPGAWLTRQLRDCGWIELVYACTRKLNTKIEPDFIFNNHMF